MRTSIALLLFVALAAPSWCQRVDQSGGITIIRGGSAPAPAPAPAEAAEEPAEPAEPKTEEPAAKSAPQKPRSSAAVTYKYDPSGRAVRTPASEAATVGPDSSSSTQTIRNLNGREVPYLTSSEKVVQRSGSATSSERRVQRYDHQGRPTQQEVTQIEERKLAGGAVEVTETVYREDLNGRMQAVERTVTRETVRGDVTETVTTTEKPSISGRFQAFIEERSTERRQGEDSSTVETVRLVGDGNGPLELAAREEIQMTKSGAVSTTEKTVYETDPSTGKIEFSTRQVGRLEEQADGSTVEKIETYGYSQAGGARNVNTSRPQLQEVVERQKTLGADGVERERTTVRGVDPAEPSRFTAPVVTEKVSRPDGDGATVRTELYETSVNGRLRPTQVTIEQVEP